MKIQLKNRSKNIFIVYIDNEIRGTLPGRVLRFFSLLPEMENDLPAERKEELLAEIDKFNWNKLLNFLSYRERSEWECRCFLKDNFLPLPLIEKLVDKAVSSNLIDDVRFAEIYVQDLLAKKKSKNQIKAKLIEKHLSESLIAEVLERYCTEQQKEEILLVNFDKAAGRFSSLPAEIRKEKILNYLVRKGFSYGEIKQKMDEEGY